VAKEIPTVMIWRTGTYSILKKNNRLFGNEQKKTFMVIHDAGFWRIVEHKNIPILFLNKDISLCSALGVYLIWKVAVLCPCQVFVPLLVSNV
jgi:hypothetical protein